MRKLEMAVLYDGPGGWWETVIVEVEAPDLAVAHELEELGRKKLLEMERQGELGDFSGSYLFSILNDLYGSSPSENDVPPTDSADLDVKTRHAAMQRGLSEMYVNGEQGLSPKKFDRLDTG